MRGGRLCSVNSCAVLLIHVLISGGTEMRRMAEIAGVGTVGALRDVLANFPENMPVSDCLGEDLLLLVFKDDNGQQYMEIG